MRASALDALRSRRLRSVLLHDRCEPAAFRSAVAGRRLLDDRVLPALQHAGSGVLHVADAGSAPRRGARRILRPPAFRSTDAICDSCCASAGRWCSAYLARRSALLYRSAAAPGNRDLPRRRTLRAASDPAARPGRNAHRGDRAHRSSRARRHSTARSGRDNVAITSDFVGVVPPAIP